MGGIIDGEIYEFMDFEDLKELQEKTKQNLIPLSAKEAELAKLLPKEERAKLFDEQYRNPKENFEDEIKKFLKEKGID